MKKRTQAITWSKKVFMKNELGNRHNGLDVMICNLLFMEIFSDHMAARTLRLERGGSHVHLPTNAIQYEKQT